MPIVVEAEQIGAMVVSFFTAIATRLGRIFVHVQHCCRYARPARRLYTCETEICASGRVIGADSVSCSLSNSASSANSA